jgi:aryl-alcohol dehydrogenase-like predicted oxidoreductase
MQATWNILERSVGLVLAEAHSQGVGIIIKEALANGRLTARNFDPTFAPRRKILDTQAVRLGTSVDALALATVLDQSWVDVVLSGASTLAQLDSNLKALGVHLDPQVREELASLTESPADYWSIRAEMPWN